MSLDLDGTNEVAADHSSANTIRFNGKLSSEPELTESKKAVKLSYTTDKGKTSNAFIPVERVKKSSDLTSLVKTAKVGDDIILTFKKTEDGRIDGLVTVVKGRLEKVASTARPFNKFGGGAAKPYVDNTVGMIKGNAVTNAVNLAIADNDRSELNLRKNLLKVLKLHGFAESLDIKKEMVSGKGNKVVETVEDHEETLDDIM